MNKNTFATPPRQTFEDSTGFLAALGELLPATVLESLASCRRSRPGRPARVPLTQLVPALIFHFMNGAGTLGQHFLELFQAPLADSSWSDRRSRLPWEVFTQLMQRALRPLVQRRGHPEAFWRGWRRLALDGTQFSVTHTPAIKATQTKAKARRGRAAFAKIVTGGLWEVGLHNPVAAAIGHHGQSEWELGLSLLARRPKKALLLADRLYGCAAFAWQANQACQRVGSHFLMRARTQIQVQVVKRLRDGSRQVRVPVRKKGQPRVILHWLTLRQIRFRVARPGFRGVELRLWTSLLDSRQAPAQELAALYAQRWEHELFYRDLKHQLRKSEGLQSHTMETAAQEIAALILAAAVLAQERDRAAARKVPVLRVSFIKLLDLVRPLWLVFALGDDLLEECQTQALRERFYAQARRCLTPKRRIRSCPRAVRQPVSGWPRLLKNTSQHEPFDVTIV